MYICKIIFSHLTRASSNCPERVLCLFPWMSVSTYNVSENGLRLKRNLILIRGELLESFFIGSNN
jgi:hypothetical protein